MSQSNAPIGAIILGTVTVTLGAVVAAVLIARSERVQTTARKASTAVRTEVAWWKERGERKGQLRGKVEAATGRRTIEKRAQRALKAGSPGRRLAELEAETAALRAALGRT